MTIFGKVLIGLMLATAAILIVKGGGKDAEEIIVEVPSEKASSTLVSPPENNKFNGSMQDLVSRGGDYECSFTQTNDMSDSTGIVFISGKKLRGDFSTTVKAVSNMKVESHMISDGEFMYNWSSMVPTGWKIAVGETVNATSTPSSASFDYNQKLDYDCVAWTKDDAKFALPTGIKFTEITN